MTNLNTQSLWKIIEGHSPKAYRHLALAKTTLPAKVRIPKKHRLSGSDDNCNLNRHDFPLLGESVSLLRYNITDTFF